MDKVEYVIVATAVELQVLKQSYEFNANGIARYWPQLQAIINNFIITESKHPYIIINLQLFIGFVVT